MRRARLAALASLMLVVTGVTPAAGQFLRWTDEKGNVHYGQGLDSVPERYRSTAEPLDMQNRPPEPASRRSAPSRGETIVRFTPGRHIVVSVQINGAASVRMILDTGAGRTLIHPRALVAAGVSLTQGRPTVTRGVVAGAKGEAVRVRVDSLELGEARAGPMWVTAYDMGWGDELGLLGQDFLQNFNVNIDPARGIVTLAPK